MNIDRYLKLFDTTSEYEQYVGGGGYGNTKRELL